MREPPSSAGDNQLEFRLLGPLEALKHGQDCAPTAPKTLQLLAMLLLRADKIVQIDSIIQELWADEPPRSARTTMQTYVYQLRRFIEKNRRTGTDDNMQLLTKLPGYVLRIDTARIDVYVFQRLCQQGHEQIQRGQHNEAARTLRTALSLWSGPPLANVDCGPWLSAYAVELQEQKRNAHHLRIQAEIEAGMHRELIGELRSLVTSNPFDEGLHGQLIRVLDRSGRRHDALAAYRTLRATLNKELGLEPCTELQRLHHQLLTADRPPQ
ncbi:MAG: SARP family transcriptional regulator [Pseudonocardiaceae bacterium]|nr:SARP family transcriptional regulator [Pseudonocardiaceae bacterium]